MNRRREEIALLEIIATGTTFDEYPNAEAVLAEQADRFKSRLTTEQRGEIARARAGEIVFVRSTEFVEFDAGDGVQRWQDTSQGPFPVPLDGSATSALVSRTADELGWSNLLADLGIAGFRISRFEYHAAPRRIEVDPALAERLTLD